MYFFFFKRTRKAVRHNTAHLHGQEPKKKRENKEMVFKGFTFFFPCQAPSFFFFLLSVRIMFVWNTPCMDCASFTCLTSSIHLLSEPSPIKTEPFPVDGKQEVLE